MAEGVSLAQRLNRSAIRVLADFYHMDEEDEPLDEIGKHKAWLAHIHVADTGRGPPGTGQYPYAVFAKQVQAADYDGMISIECRWQDFEAQAKPALAFLRQVFT